MKKLILLTIVSISLLSCKKDDKDDNSGNPTPQTQTVNLQIDNFTTGTAVFQSSFLPGEAAAVVLGPLSNTFKISYVKFLLGGSVVPETKDVILKIYFDEGIFLADSLLFSATFSLTSSDDNLQVIDLRSNNIVITGGGSIRIALETGLGLPSVAVDADGTIDNQHNFVFTGGDWYMSSMMGITSDFIIRAVVEENI